MSQGQPRRPEGQQAHDFQGRHIKYGDVFDVSGDLAGQPVAPRDAALLQSAEHVVLDQTQKGGPAAVMQSTAALNARASHVGRGQITGPAADAGVTVTETDLPGRRVVTEYVAGQDARDKLPADKGATKEDAERVVSAEVRNKPDMATTLGGLADAVTTAARLNQERP